MKKFNPVESSNEFRVEKNWRPCYYIRILSLIFLFIISILLASDALYKTLVILTIITGIWSYHDLYKSTLININNIH